jgi:hypothetical protein
MHKDNRMKEDWQASLGKIYEIMPKRFYEINEVWK